MITQITWGHWLELKKKDTIFCGKILLRIFFPFSKLYPSWNNSNIQTGSWKEKNKKPENKTKRHWRAGNRVSMQMAVLQGTRGSCSWKRLNVWFRLRNSWGCSQSDRVPVTTSAPPRVPALCHLARPNLTNGAASDWGASSPHSSPVTCVQPADLLIQRWWIKGYRVGPKGENEAWAKRHEGTLI